MALDFVEVQRTDRFFVFGARSSCSKVHWPKTAQNTAASKPPGGGGSTSTSSRALAQRTRPAPKMASEGSAALAVSVGARKVLPEDVLLVAVHGARVDLHPASLDKACPAPSTPSRGGGTAFAVRYAWLARHPCVRDVFDVNSLLLCLSLWTRCATH